MAWSFDITVKILLEKLAFHLEALGLVSFRVFHSSFPLMHTLGWVSGCLKLRGPATQKEDQVEFLALNDSLAQPQLLSPCGKQNQWKEDLCLSLLVFLFLKQIKCKKKKFSPNYPLSTGNTLNWRHMRIESREMNKICYTRVGACSLFPFSASKISPSPKRGLF